jgi:16S rRNA (guanine966-N2)-methyltransferase
MRINAGTYKGFPILTEDVPNTRPTSDKLKQVIFNALGKVVRGSIVLDLFSGFGSLGLEALSRGAEKVVFVESNARCNAILMKNIAKTATHDRTVVLTRDVFDALGKLQKEEALFDVVLADPPYKKGLNTRLLNSLSHSAILKPAALLILQQEKGQAAGPEGTWRVIRSYPHGKSVVTIYRKGI